MNLGAMSRLELPVKMPPQHVKISSLLDSPPYDPEAIYDIEGDSEDASPTPTMSSADYDTLEGLLTKIIDHPTDG